MKQRGVDFSEVQLERLEMESERRGLSVPELVRRFVDIGLDSTGTPWPVAQTAQGYSPHSSPPTTEEVGQILPATCQGDPPPKGDQDEASPACTRADRNFLLGDTEAPVAGTDLFGAVGVHSLHGGGGEGSGGEAPNDGTEELLRFSCKGPVLAWSLTRRKLDEYQATFPGVDVFAVLRVAGQWIIDNPGKRKTAAGMPRFLGAWISRQVNSGKAPLLLPVIPFKPAAPAGDLILARRQAQERLHALYVAGKVSEAAYEQHQAEIRRETSFFEIERIGRGELLYISPAADELLAPRLFAHEESGR